MPIPDRLLTAVAELHYGQKGSGGRSLHLASEHTIIGLAKSAADAIAFITFRRSAS